MAGLLPGETWRGPTNQSARWGLALVFQLLPLVLFPSWRGQGIIISLRNYLEGLGAVLYMPCHSSMPSRAIMGILEWASRAEGGDRISCKPSIHLVRMCVPSSWRGERKVKRTPSFSFGLSESIAARQVCPRLQRHIMLPRARWRLRKGYCVCSLSFLSPKSYLL